MKATVINISTTIFIIFLICSGICMGQNIDDNKEVSKLTSNITWVDNACIKIDGSKKIYFDPYNINNNETADIILVTHDHYDHFSMNNINKIADKNTVIVGPECVTQSVNLKKKTVRAGDKIKIAGVQIEVVPSYNIEINNHAEYKGHVGYIVTMDNVSYYHPGDSDFIPEMENINTDVAFLPVCGKYMMNADDAVKAANVISPKVVIPIHYGSVVGSKADAQKFSQLYSGNTVILDTE